MAHVDLLGFELLTRGAAEEHDAPEVRAAGRTARQRERFGECRRAAQLVAAWFDHVAPGDEGRLLEFLQRHRQHRVADELSIGLEQIRFHLRHRPSLDAHVGQLFQRDVAVRLYGHALIQFGDEGERDVEDIARRDAVASARPPRPFVVGGVLRRQMGRRRRQQRHQRDDLNR